MIKKNKQQKTLLTKKTDVQFEENHCDLWKNWNQEADIFMQVMWKLEGSAHLKLSY